MCACVCVCCAVSVCMCVHVCELCVCVCVCVDVWVCGCVGVSVYVHCTFDSSRRRRYIENGGSLKSGIFYFFTRADETLTLSLNL